MTKKLACFVLVSILALQSCNDSVRDNDVSTIAAKEAIMAKTFAISIFKEIYYYAGNDSIYLNNYSVRPKTACVQSINLVKEDQTFPYKLNIQFVQGSNTCDMNQRISGGKINSSIVGLPTVRNSTIAMDFDSLKIEDYFVSGKLNLSLREAGNTRKYDIHIDNMLIQNDTTNGFFSFNGQLDVAVGIGFNFNNINLEMRGKGKGLSSKGSAYTTQTLSAMSTNFTGNCNYWQKLDFELNAATLEPRFIQRESTNCNNSTVSIVIAGRTIDFLVP